KRYSLIGRKPFIENHSVPAAAGASDSVCKRVMV
ncbi:MAG: hypothetical protein ACI8XD_000260, partial [Thermoproteota archaeon]